MLLNGIAKNYSADGNAVEAEENFRRIIRPPCLGYFWKGKYKISAGIGYSLIMALRVRCEKIFLDFPKNIELFHGLKRYRDIDEKL
ncbi:hypothetical protein [Paenibacillus ihbetae]|uniref:Uncharacterized protein n=1 Tax=Paenibacillus ihbetae TaxID=1870820 RepID=A0ABX3JRH3_9BACL|nr:hypothetical protein [Paenibacillus ihbetae]OOC52394.1 hypothetical protein BBD40_29135 [Paenibacillus ihbetae]